ncbi:hypothetical protein C3K47_08790 [Solitalea longa]|uniref:Uncharacterized protein n=1 Tax=Solitalea longa TaxID=2079460 RepID=A0A2S5A3P6_9SPHI|nr:DEAD/DEAH box helicase family protein [Solitalea longa]POY37144.1 hypothetical protein C3K47_08790 [Solitalea longa]
MKKPITIILSNKDYITKAFKVLPSNAFIDKGRCGIGGTTLCLITLRHSIIIVPTVGIIKNKMRSDATNKDRNSAIRKIFGVYKGITISAIKAELLQSDGFFKIMTTPDGFKKIIKAAEESISLDRLYSDFFVLLDECHTSVTEKFRKRILDPFKWLWNFKNKSFISATPFYFSDERIKQLDYYKIRFNEPYLGYITVVETFTIKSCVNYFLSHADSFPGNLHFFYNSVTEIAELIRYVGINDCNIYCADKEENMERMDDVSVFFNPEPVKGEYKKINFYTSRYFEGIDIEDENATIILVTDVNCRHTKVGIRNKGVQAIGRIRSIPYALYHITNHRKKHFMKTIESFYTEYRFHAMKLIENYNQYVDECKANNVKPLTEEIEKIQSFSDIEANQIATLNDTKLDQFVNEDLCNEEFNHLSFIIYAWEESGYKVELKKFHKPIESSPSKEKRKSKRDKLKATIDLMEKLEQGKKESLFSFNDAALGNIKISDPFAFEVYYELGKEKIEELNFSIKDLQKELILKKNEKAENQLNKLLIVEFIVDETYAKEYIKTKLQELYDKVGLKETAKATDLQKRGWFTTQEDKKKINGKSYPAFYIQAMSFKLRVIAESMINEISFFS